MEMVPDFARLRSLFEQPGLRWIMTRLAERLSRGRPLRGLVANAQASADERRALDDLLGRHSTAGSRLSLDLATLEETLRAAGMAGGLEDAVIACRGPVENKRAQAERRRDEWETLDLMQRQSNVCHLKVHTPCRASPRNVPLRNRRKPFPASVRVGSGFCT